MPEAHFLITYPATQRSVTMAASTPKNALEHAGAWLRDLPMGARVRVTAPRGRVTEWERKPTTTGASWAPVGAEPTSARAVKTAHRLSYDRSEIRIERCPGDHGIYTDNCHGCAPNWRVRAFDRKDTRRRAVKVQLGEGVRVERVSGDDLAPLRIALAEAIDAGDMSGLRGFGAQLVGLGFNLAAAQVEAEHKPMVAVAWAVLVQVITRSAFPGESPSGLAARAARAALGAIGAY